MPCFITGSAEGDARLMASEANAEATKATRMLCEVMGLLDKYENEPITTAKVLSEISGETNKWWRKHKEVDAKRESMERALARREEVRQEALSKLNEEQKRALGVK